MTVLTGSSTSLSRVRRVDNDRQRRLALDARWSIGRSAIHIYHRDTAHSGPKSLNSLCHKIFNQTPHEQSSLSMNLIHARLRPGGRSLYRNPRESPNGCLLLVPFRPQGIPDTLGRYDRCTAAPRSCPLFAVNQAVDSAASGDRGSLRSRILTLWLSGLSGSASPSNLSIAVPSFAMRGPNCL
jgi:hypothetical protein